MVIRRGSRPRLAILTNMIPPYRIDLLERLGDSFETKVFLSGFEGNRSWNPEPTLRNVSVQESWGLTIDRSRGCPGFDRRFLHITPGYLKDLSRFRPHAVISAELGARSIAAMAYGLSTRTPVWVWWGGTPHTERNIGVARRLLRRSVAPLIPRWISYGTSATRYIRSLRVPMSRVLQVQNVIDEGPFQTDVTPAPITLPRPIGLFVGQFIGRKGLDRLLRAAARAKRIGREFSLVLVGSGPDEPRLRTFAKRFLADRVAFFPSVGHRQLPGLYRAADFFVFPTLEDVWGLVANEALWSGLPVLCSIYAGCVEDLIPASNRFDPLSDQDFDRGIALAVSRRLAPPDVSRLWTSERLAAAIAEDVEVFVSKRSAS